MDLDSQIFVILPVRPNTLEPVPAWIDESDGVVPILACKLKARQKLITIVRT